MNVCIDRICAGSEIFRKITTATAPLKNERKPKKRT